MIPVHAANERIKRRYFRYMKEARGLSPTTINSAALAIAEYEQFTARADFGSFTSSRAVGYKRHLWAKGGKRVVQLSARATVVSKARHVQQFFRWLADQDGYRSRIRHTDLDYFNPAQRDAALARTRRDKPAPTLEQVRQVIKAYPATTHVELRNRALIAAALLTGARVSALASLKLKHLRRDGLGIDQDAREVRTKFAKSQTTFFFPVGDDVRKIFLDYVDHLRARIGWGRDDPLFPATARKLDNGRQCDWSGLSRDHWKTADPIRSIFRDAFAAAGVPYFTPHTLRNCLTHLGQQMCCTPEEMKAWSQNLGHDEVLTTMTSYGHVPLQKQAELLGRLSEGREANAESEEVERLLRQILEARRRRR